MQKVMFKSLRLALKICLLGLVSCGPLGGVHSWIPKTAASLRGGGSGPGWAASFSDWEARKKLLYDLEKTDSELYRQVTVYVLDGRILVVGVLHTRDQAERLKTFFEKHSPKETIINKTVFAAKYPLSVRMNDLWLEKKIETMLFFSSVSSYNFDAVVFNKIAYVLGVARSQKEHDMALELIKGLSGLVSVEDYVRVIKDSRSDAEPESFSQRISDDLRQARSEQKRVREEGSNADIEGIPRKIPAAVRPRVEVLDVKDGDLG